MASETDPLFLQVKEARQSVLEAYAGKSAHPNHGQRIVIATLLQLKALFRVDPLKEAEAFATEQRRGAEPLERRTLIVENPTWKAWRSRRFPVDGKRV